MSSLLDKFAGRIDVIYIDPPFGTGTDFTFFRNCGGGSGRYIAGENNRRGEGIQRYVGKRERFLVRYDIRQAAPDKGAS